MGSAFYAESLYGQRSSAVVTFLTFPSDKTQDLLVHQKTEECQIEYPHEMIECGRFNASIHSAKAVSTEKA
jgi:hypothetical protein